MTYSIEELAARAINGSRIVYVDPNNASGTIDGVPLTPDYTDLCISFDLQVETVPRTGYVCGEKSNAGNNGQLETYHFFWTSYQANSKAEDNVVSFMKGQDYNGTSFLTTYYTDINLDDFGRSEIVEGLGVESVTVSFENFYVPTIKMRFIDVRGASLFGRQEVTHVNEKITQDSIWGCFFTFPYPKFRLQIKGFYGHPITYQLTCSDFRAKFNSNTGNFEIDVTFLGYDYGIMADIPTAYLIAAPYSKYIGEDYWNQHASSEEWRLSDDKQPKRLREILDLIKTAMTYADNKQKKEENGEESDGTEETNAMLKERNLKNVISLYNGLEGVVISYYGNSVKSDNIGTLYKFKLKDKDYLLFDAMGDEFWGKVRNTAYNFYSALDSYKANFPEDSSELDVKKMPFGREIKKNESIGGNIKVDEDKPYIQTPSYTTSGNTVKRYNLSEAMSEIIVGTNFTEDEAIRFFADEIKGYCCVLKYSNGEFKSLDPPNWLGMKLGSKNGYQIIPLGSASEIFSNMLAKSDTYKEEKKAEVKQERDERESYLERLDIYSAAGLLPTIENVFKTIICHLETFMAMMYQCKQNIDDQIIGGNRTPQKLGISDFNFTDINGKEVAVSGVPPWVGVSINEKKGETGSATYDSVNTIGWVGEFEGETQWEEAKLIEGLSMAVFNTIGDDNDTSPRSYASAASVACLPSDVFSGIFPSAATNNPYTLGEYLGIRAAALFGVVGINPSDAASFGKADALNLFSALGGKSALKNLTNRNDFREAVKTAPTTTSEQGTEKVYTQNPGCEGRQAQILTDNGNGKYRYTYSEIVNGRQGNRKYSGLYGMVPVVESGPHDIFASDASTQVFECTSPSDGAYRNISAHYLFNENGNVGKIYHKGTTHQFINRNTSLNNSRDGSEKNFKNDAMFSILNTGNGRSYKFSDAIDKFKQDKLMFGTYEDDDTEWRNGLKKYWNVGGNTNYFVEGVNMNEYRWEVYDGGMTDVFDQAKPFTNIFNSRFFYMQNRVDLKHEQREAAKCILFLSTAGYDIQKVCSLFTYGKHNHIIQELPYGAILLVGGMLWRAERGEDCIHFSDPYTPFDFKTGYQNTSILYSTISSTPFDTYDKPWLILKTRQGGGYANPFIIDKKPTGSNLSVFFDINIKNKLISEFEHFLKGKWEKICGKYEYRPKKNTNGDQSYYNDKTYFEWLKDAMNTNKAAILQEFEATTKRMNNDADIAELDSMAYIVRGTLNNQSDDTDTEITFDKSCWDSYSDAFCSKLAEIANSEEPVAADNTTGEEDDKEMDLKLAMYMYLKRLWDRWFMTSTLEEYKVQNYMQNFVFMDSLYRNIGSMLHINCEKFYNALSNINGKSMLYQLFSQITTDHNCLFFAYPDYFGFGDDNREQPNAKVKHLTPEQKIQDMFKPMPFTNNPPLETSNKYVVVLIYNQNENLSDMNGYKYDGFDIFSHDGTPNVLPATFTTPAIDKELVDAPSEQQRVRRYGYNIPSFGVTFGRMENSIFKNVDIGMTNPIATEQSINALSIIAEKGNSDGKVVCFYGQDLYPVYNGYSYTCTVEMMGNAQIMPLMYFQLLNIPMFRGTYMIYSVTHTMRPGDMTTTFQGQKLSRNALPFAQKWFTRGAMTVGQNGEYVEMPSGNGSGSTSEDTSGGASNENTQDIDEGSGNIDFKWSKGEAELKMSGGRGITHSMEGDPKTLCESWLTTITVRYHTNKFDKDGVQQEATKSLQVNKFIADEIKEIFEEIYNTKVDDKYFAINSLYTYSYRLIKNPKYPNSKKLSNHSYGIAIDINAGKNPFNKSAGGHDDWMTMRTYGHPVVQIFYKRRPWGWGGRYGDWMHFSYLNGG